MKRILSFLLSLSILFSCLSFPALAQDDLPLPAEEILAAAEEEPEATADGEAAEEEADPAVPEEAAGEEPETTVAEETAEEAAEPAASEETAEEPAVVEEVAEEAEEPAAPEETAEKDEEPAETEETVEEAADPSEAEEAAEEAAEPVEAEEAAEEAETASEVLAEAFREGYVSVDAGVTAYGEADHETVAGVFTAPSAAYAKLEIPGANAPEDWLELTFDTEDSAENAAEPLIVFVRLRNVKPLTEEETAELTEALEDPRVWQGHALPVAFFTLAEAEAVPVPEEAADDGAEAADEPAGAEIPAEEAAEAVPAEETEEPADTEEAEASEDAEEAEGTDDTEEPADAEEAEASEDAEEAEGTDDTEEPADAEEAAETLITVEETVTETVSEPAADALAVTPQNTLLLVSLGDTVTFTASATSGADLQWQYDGGTGDWTNIPENKNWHGTTTNTLTFSAMASRAKYSYRLVATLGAETVISDTMRFEIAVAPEFTVQPQDVFAAAGEEVFFTAQTASTASLQWQYDNGTGDWTDIPENKNWHGTRTEELTFTATASRAKYAYRVIASNPAGEVISQTAHLAIMTAPAIEAEPENQRALSGAEVSFTAAATTAVDWQWQYDGGTGTWVNIPENNNWHGTQTDTLTFAATTSRARQHYRAIATNVLGEAMTKEVSLELIVKPAFTAQPEAMTAAAGQTVTFTAEASGDPAWTWQYDGGTGTWTDVPDNQNWTGARTNTLSFTATASRAKYAYRVIAENEAGNATSKAVRFTLLTPPVFSAQPYWTDALSGETVTFTAEAAPDAAYQWQYNGGTGVWVNIPENNNWHGTQTPELSFTANTSRAKQSYRVIASNAAGETVSAETGFGLITKPVFNSQPTKVEALNGETVTFTAEAAPDAAYQWQYDGGTGEWVNIPENNNWHGTQTPELSFTANSSRAKQKYRVIAANAAGETISKAVALVLVTKPVFTVQPETCDALSGDTVTFTVRVSGNPDLQWQYDGGTGTWTDIPENSNWHGTQTTSLSFAAAASRAKYSYRAVATNMAGEVISDEVSFTLITVPRFTTQPVSYESALKATVAFTAKTDVPAALQWQYDNGTGEWTDIPENSNWHGTQTEKLTFTATAARTAYKFRVNATNAAGSATSREVRFTLPPKPEFVTQPENTRAPAGTAVTLTAETKYATAWQWQVYTADTGAWADIKGSSWQGATTDTLTFTQTAARSTNKYRLKAISGGGETYSTSVVVRLIILPTKLTLSESEVTLEPGQTAAVTATILPEDTSDKTVSWTSSDTRVATVSASGKITAVAHGIATVTATSNADPNLKQTVKVTVQTDIKGFDLSDTSLTLAVGKTAVLSVTTIPEKTQLSVSVSTSFISSNTNVVTVSTSGSVYAKASGSADITVRVKSSLGTTIEKTCKVTVYADITSVKVSPAPLAVPLGKTATLTPTINPASVTEGTYTITWESGDETVARVSSKGVVSGVKSGDTTITCTVTSIFGTTRSTTCQVRVRRDIIGVKLSSSAITLKVNGTHTLTASPRLATADCTTTTTWKSSDTSVATVGTSSGTVTAKKAGRAIITATMVSEFGTTFEATCEVLVVVDITGVTLNVSGTEVAKGGKVTLQIGMIKPTTHTVTTTNKWTSSDTSIATVSNGVVTGNKPGKAVITLEVTAKETGTKVKATCSVNVYQDLTGVTLSHTSLTLNVGEQFQLARTLQPGDISVTTETVWSSDNTSAVTVGSGSGLVVARAPGKANIKVTVKSARGTIIEKICKVTVQIKPIGVKLSKNTLTLLCYPNQESTTLTASLVPADATVGATYTWSSNNTEVATVDSRGKVTAVWDGEAVITVTATTSEGDTFQDFCKVLVATDIETVEFFHATAMPGNWDWGDFGSDSVLTLELGTTYNLGAFACPDHVNVGVTFTWTNSNSTAVGMSSQTKGNILWEGWNEPCGWPYSYVTLTPKALGTAKITVKAVSTLGTTRTNTITVNVIDKVVDITDVTLNTYSLNLNKSKTATLTATVWPTDNNVSPTLTWTSSNESVAIVNSSGKVTAVGRGTAYITVTAKATTGTTVSATCTVTVNETKYRALVVGVQHNLGWSDTYVEDSVYIDGWTYPYFYIKNSPWMGSGYTRLASTLGRVYGGAATDNQRFATTQLYDPEDSDLESAIRTTFSGTTDDDISLFYINTHGRSSNDGELSMSFKKTINATNVSNFLNGGHEVVSFQQLASWMNTYVKGKVIVFIDSCGAGSSIYDPSVAENSAQGIGVNDSGRIVSEAIAAFSSYSFTEEEEYDGEPRANYGELRTNKFYVLAASRHQEDSWVKDGSSTGYSYFNYDLCAALGTSGNMPADQNGDGAVCIEELFTYIKYSLNYDMDYSDQKQHIQRYPVGNTDPLFH